MEGWKQRGTASTIGIENHMQNRSVVNTTDVSGNLAFQKKIMLTRGEEVVGRSLRCNRISHYFQTVAS